MKKKIGFIVLVALTGCHQDTIPADIPEPIKAKVETFKNQRFLCNDASVKEFMFQGAKVYGFSDGTCAVDGASGIMDVKGNSVCTLGGLAGNTICNGESFSKATFLRTIWKNK